ncbi:hypothetical protein ACFVW2_31515 [Streptomyces sp. NPDC058171]
MAERGDPNRPFAGLVFCRTNGRHQAVDTIDHVLSSAQQTAVRTDRPMCRGGGWWGGVAEGEQAGGLDGEGRAVQMSARGDGNQEGAQTSSAKAVRSATAIWSAGRVPVRARPVV